MRLSLATYCLCHVLLLTFSKMEAFLKFVEKKKHFKFVNSGKGRHQSKWTWLVSNEENHGFDGGEDCHFESGPESDFSETKAAVTSARSSIDVRQ